jgi:DNA-binding beta-propeller fold protein YncE
MRRLLLAAVPAASVALAACTGSTEPATKVTNVSAQLNARGSTDDGPASWWWEYDSVRSDLGTANDTEICGNPPEPDRRCGPASGGSQSDQVPLSVTVTGLTPGTTYYFRACGQDVNDTQPTCASTHSFRTLAGTRYAFDRAWGSRGSANGQFFVPLYVATDTGGNVYVADSGNDRVQKFTSTGAFITTWGSKGAGSGQFAEEGPRGVATDATGNVYVADHGSPLTPGNFRIQKFSSSGGFITTWGTVGSGDNQFLGPKGLATDRAGSVYVADYPLNSFDHHRVKKYASTGAFITKWGGFGSGAGRFREPNGVATDAAGHVYVADSANDRVQKFTSSGAFVTTWGSSGAGNGAFHFPCGVATDSAGGVYVTDGFNDNLQKFTSAGGFITSWGGSGASAGQFSDPCGIATDSLGSVYVADVSNNRIQTFKPIE